MSKTWVVAAGFFDGQDDVWLDDFISDDTIEFKKVAPAQKPGDWHHRRSQLTSLGEWKSHLLHVRSAFIDRPDGIITCFPQLALCAAVLKRLTFSSAGRPKIIAYNFNLGALPKGVKKRLLRLFSEQINTYVVHSPTEISSYAEVLGVPEDRVVFIPLQRGEIDLQRDEDKDSPYILSMGSAGRDFDTLIKAVDNLGIRTVIVSKPSIVKELPKTSNVEFLSGLTQEKCLELLASCRLSVTPISNLESASGQVTFLNGMRLGVPVVATSSPGTDGYIEHEQNGILVEPFNVGAMQAAIKRLWESETLRDAMSDRARTDAREKFSDEAISRELHRIVQSVSKTP
ncbi:hypothetical protein RA28_10470 [Ruegeria sp. ANG-S4]|uniref:glycosyltransferase n=1 Tax=Ruegeria sp. ANG-S4 TaxID=1577904 RepID=UPI0005808E06|nr:glycosyltransferase [Ruegeria sp. ANG-S4]KIC45497.1 hypothetical protein RA28_10470 [Ruegeria sp. ANG-S4]